MAEGTTSLSWSISTEHAIGRFELQFALPNFEQLSKSPPLPGAVVNIAQELEVKFDEFPVTFGASAYPCRGARHTVTVRPNPSSLFLNTPIKLVWRGEPAGNLGVVVTLPLADEKLLTLEGVTWELNCLNTSHNGSFSLQVMLESGEETSPLTMSLGHNLMTAQHWSEPSEGTPAYPRTLHGIRSSSSFLNVPVSGAPVSLHTGGDTQQRSTDVKGELRVDAPAHVIVKMWIVNPYDGSIV